MLPRTGRRSVAHNQKFVFLMDLELEPLIGTTLDVWRGFVFGNDPLEAFARCYLVRIEAIACQAVGREYPGVVPVALRDQTLQNITTFLQRVTAQIAAIFVE